MCIKQGRGVFWEKLKIWRKSFIERVIVLWALENCYDSKILGVCDLP